MNHIIFTLLYSRRLHVTNLRFVEMKSTEDLLHVLCGSPQAENYLQTIELVL